MIQHTNIVYICNFQILSIAEQEIALYMLTQLLEVQYSNTVLKITRNKYYKITGIEIQFNNIEDATHFKLTHKCLENEK